MSHPCRVPPATDGNQSWCSEGCWLRSIMSRQGAGQPLAMQVGPLSSKSGALFFLFNQWNISGERKLGMGMWGWMRQWDSLIMFCVVYVHDYCGGDRRGVLSRSVLHLRSMDHDDPRGELMLITGIRWLFNDQHFQQKTLSSTPDHSSHPCLLLLSDSVGWLVPYCIHSSWSWQSVSRVLVLCLAGPKCRLSTKTQEILWEVFIPGWLQVWEDKGNKLAYQSVKK